MRYISRITYVDGNCVYNNKEYWSKIAVQNPMTPENFEEHEVLDFLGNAVTYDRYIDEFNNNINRLSVLDGIAGEVEYNITVGNEFIALPRTGGSEVLTKKSTFSLSSTTSCSVFDIRLSILSSNWFMR